MNENIMKIENNIKKINDLHDIISKKVNEVNQRIETFNKKKNLKLEDSTPFLVFQNKILQNELLYLNNHKQIINSSLNNMIYGISENITMMALTVITMYKDVITGENKLVKISHKKDDNIKIVSDITYNLELINSMIIDLRKYNEELNDTIKKNNLHAKTLHENIEFVCGHVELEYKKHTNDIQKALEYFTQYTEKIIEQNEYMILLKFVS
uniref:Uncharacterized protein n=1 Tax=viral metagenome TaxID=1070528 RepID=A0A6C0HVP9_9ZZZZ